MVEEQKTDNHLIKTFDNNKKKEVKKDADTIAKARHQK